MGLLSAITGFLKPEPPPDRATTLALERIAELVDPLLKAAPGFDHHLAAPVHHALGYCEGLVAGLPGPFDISARSFASDPLVHALFATADDIRTMLGKSQAVRDYLADPGCYASDHFYALLAARRQEKRQLGMAIQGDVIQNDVPQTVLYFSDHTLVEPQCDLGRTLERLRCSAFDSLLKSFHAHVEALRLERDATRGDSAVERSHLAMLRGTSPGPEYAVHTRRLAELDAHLREVADSLMPDQLVGALADFLMAPETSLALKPVSVTVNRLGVITDEAAAAAPDVDTLHFPELTGRDKRLYLVLLARIDRREAQEAVDSVRDLQHRFMII